MTLSIRRKTIEYKVLFFWLKTNFFIVRPFSLNQPKTTFLIGMTEFIQLQRWKAHLFKVFRITEFLNHLEIIFFFVMEIKFQVVKIWELGQSKEQKKKKKLKIIGSNNTSQNYQQNWFIKKILIANKKKYGWQFWLP